ncbi:AIR carboxylase family protein [Patescibacteria group bacterium]
MLVPILMGSESDKVFAEKITNILDEWKIPYEITVASAHKVPEKVFEVVQKYNESDEDICYITIAGRSNGLSGVVAANSNHPVIACPPFSGKEDMLINMHSTLQMPSDTPVLTVVDPQNAAMAVTRILSNSDPELKKRVAEHIKSIKAKFN